MDENAPTPKRIGNVWSGVRGVLQEYSTKDIKGIIGKADLPIFKIKYDGTYKGPFLDEADKLVRGLDADSRDLFVKNCTMEIIAFEKKAAVEISKHGGQPNNQTLENLERVLVRAGFNLNGNEISPA